MFFSDEIYLYILLLSFLVVGVFFKDKVANIREYALGTRSFSTPVLIATMVATLIGGGSTIGTVAAIYDKGIWVAISILIMPVGYCLFAHFIVPKLNSYYGCLSVSEIIGKMYGDNARKITGIISCIFMFGALAAQVKGLSWVLESVFSSNVLVSLIISFSIIIGYTAFGGVTSVIRTDVIQFMIFIIILPIVAHEIISAGGGVEKIVKSVPVEKLDLLGNATIWSLLGMFLFKITPNVSPIFFQRLLIGRDTEKNRAAVYSVAFVYLLDAIFVTSIAFLAMSKFSGTLEPKYAIFAVVKEFFTQKWVYICFGSALIVIIASTADSIVNTMSVVLINDVLARKIPIEKEIQYLRGFTVISGILAMLISLKFQHILDIVWFFGEFYDSTVFIPLIAGLFLKRKSNKMFWSNIIVASTAFCYMRFSYPELEMGSFLVTFTSSIVAYFGAAYLENIKIDFNFKNMLQELSNEFESKNGRIRKIAITAIPVFVIAILLKQRENHLESNIIIESVGLMLSLLMIFADHIFGKKIHYKNLYICFALWFCFPFISIYWYFHNDLIGLSFVSAIASFSLLVASFSWAAFLFNIIMAVSIGSITYAAIFNFHLNEFGGDLFSLIVIMSYLLFISYLIIMDKEEESEIKIKKLDELDHAIGLLESLKISREAEQIFDEIMLDFDLSKENYEHKCEVNVLKYIKHLEKFFSYHIYKKELEIYIDNSVDLINSNFSKPYFYLIFHSILRTLFEVLLKNNKIYINIIEQGQHYELSCKLEGLPLELYKIISYAEIERDFINFLEAKEQLESFGHEVLINDNSITIRINQGH